MSNKEKVIEDLQDVAELVGDDSLINKKISEANNELEVVEALVKSLIEKRSKTNEISEQDFSIKYEEYDKQYKKIGERINALLKEKELKIGKKNWILAIVASLQNEPNKILKWNKETWMLVVESGTIHRDGTITFKFHSGQEIRV